MRHDSVTKKSQYQSKEGDSNLFLSLASLTRLVLSCLLSCLVLSCLSCLVLSCLLLSCLVLSCLVLSCLVLSCLLSCLFSLVSRLLSGLFFWRWKENANIPCRNLVRKRLTFHVHPIATTKNFEKEKNKKQKRTFVDKMNNMDCIHTSQRQKWTCSLKTIHAQTRQHKIIYQRREENDKTRQNNHTQTGQDRARQDKRRQDTPYDNARQDSPSQPEISDFQDAVWIEK